MTTATRNITREHCGKCTKQIYLGQSAVVCGKCDLIFHSSCLNEYKIFRDQLYCLSCIDKYDIVHYKNNPFCTANKSNDQHDRFYNHDATDFTDTFDNISRVLEEYSSMAYTRAAD